MATGKKVEPSDFNASDLLAARDAHEKGISDLNERMAKVEGNLETPQQLADYFERSARDSRQLESVFAKMFCRFMNDNDEVKEAVRKKLEEIDRNFFFKTWKRTWFIVYSVGVAIGSIFLKALVDWIISLIPHH